MIQFRKAQNHADPDPEHWQKEWHTATKLFAFMVILICVEVDVAAGRGRDAVPRAAVRAGGRPPLLLLRRRLGRLHAQPPHHSDLPSEKQARGEQCLWNRNRRP
jgi:hypothetical protein